MPAMSEKEKLRSKLRDSFLELLYPTRCCFCHRLSGKGKPVCKFCREKYPDVPHEQQEQRLRDGTKCYSPFYYAGDVRRSLLRYKFENLSGYGAIYGEFLLKCLDENEISCDSITWVPLSRARLRRRGYDQARLLAEVIAKEKGIPCEAFLKKIRNNPAQSGSGGYEARRVNAAGAYCSQQEDKLAGKNILLVDDIVTTGATAMECARTLRKAGAKRVTVLTVARRKD